MLTMDTITQSRFVRSDGFITREAYYFLRTLLNSANGNFSINDLQILTAFDSDATSIVNALSARLDSISVQLAMLPEQNSAVASIQSDVRDLQTQIQLISTNSSMSNGILSIQFIKGNGAPTDGVTGAGIATPDEIDYIDKTNHDRYMNVGTLASPTWKLWQRSA